MPVCVPQVSYEDFKLHMAQMYQQYERQQVTHVADDPAQVANHPISTISGLEDDQAKIQQEVKKVYG